MITINDQINTIHRAIKILAGVCDHAETVDGNGFNGGDAAFGHSLADKETLTPRMAISGLKMLKKYHGQLGPVIMEQLNQIDPNALEDAPKPQPKQNGKELAPDQPLDIPTLLPWSEVKVVGGDKKVRSASINDNFWAAWASRKPELQAAGISVSKYQGQWQASWWQTPRAQSPAVAAAPVEVKVMTVPVDVAGKCLSYQVAGAAKLATGLKTYNVALDASDTGTGKTYMALAACKVLGLRPFVLCPKAVIPSWRKAAKHFGMEMGLACNYEFVKTGKTHSVKMTKVTGKKKVETHFTWDVPSDAVLVFDEVHRCKAKDSQNAELLIAAKRSGRPVLMLSATAASDPLQMRALAYTLGLYQTEKGFWSWATKNGCKKGRFGFEFVGGKDAIKKLHHEIFDSGKGNRMRIANLPDFPQTSIHAETVEMDNADEIAKAYSDMEYELSRLAEVQAKDRQAIILTEILRARQKSEILKVPTLVEMVTDAIEEGMSVAVFVNFDASIDSLAAKLQTKCFIRGGQSTEEREANIQAFQRGNFPRLSLICPTFSAQDLKQCVGRVWRAFDKNENPVWSNACSRIILCNIKAGGVGVSLHHLGGAKSIQKIVFAAGTIEEDAAASVERKIDNIDMLNDGDLTSGIKILSNEMQKQLL